MGQVILLSLLASNICVSQILWLRVLHGRKVSMYLRVLIPILFSRCVSVSLSHAGSHAAAVGLYSGACADIKSQNLTVKIFFLYLTF